MLTAATESEVVAFIKQHGGLRTDEGKAACQKWLSTRAFDSNRAWGY